ncbi:FtsW/RodA/SpoVE family cell cycle protein [Hydrogenobaculum acidophilum]
MRPIDVVLTILLIQIIGLVGVYSSTYTNYGFQYGLFIKQLIYIIFSWFIMYGMSKVKFSSVLSVAPLIYGINLFLLIAVMFVGKTVYGAKRWIGIGPLGIQPSEFMKASVILIVDYIIYISPYLKAQKILYILLSIGIPFLIIYKQPDLGSAVIMLLPVMSLVFFAKFPKNFFRYAIPTLIVIPIVTWHFMKPYQKERILTVINPKAYYAKGGYQLIQSIISIGSGRIFGKGFLKGTQSHLLFLPERHTDFIFSVIAEEFGFVVSVVILLLYLYLVLRLLSISYYLRLYTEKIFVVMVASFIFFHSLINLAMAMGIMPVVGIPLPFISYGGSNIVVSSILLGLFFSIVNSHKEVKFSLLSHDKIIHYDIGE